MPRKEKLWSQKGGFISTQKRWGRTSQRLSPVSAARQESTLSGRSCTCLSGVSCHVRAYDPFATHKVGPSASVRLYFGSFALSNIAMTAYHGSVVWSFLPRLCGRCRHDRGFVFDVSIWIRTVFFFTRRKL